LNVAEAKRSGVRREAIFARAEEVKETEVRHVGCGSAKGVASDIGRSENIVEEGKRDRFDSAWWGVLFGVASVQGGEADIELAKAVQARVNEAQAGEARGH
jgi:hypothetical protein